MVFAILTFLDVPGMQIQNMKKITWSCIKAIKQGKKNCPHSKSISEKDLEAAFVDAFNILCTQHKEITDEF